MQGELSEFTLAELLQLFALAERTGTIHVTSDKHSSRILMESGRVVGIGLEDFDVHHELLACELMPVRSGVSLDSITPSPATPGLSFIVRNVIEPNRWDLFARRCLEQDIYPLLSKEQGAFTVTIERVPFAPLAISIPVQQLVLDGSRWEAEMAEHRTDGYGLHTRWARNEADCRPGKVTDIEWLIWCICAEPESIGNVARRICVPDLDATAAVRKLASAGVLRRVS